MGSFFSALGGTYAQGMLQKKQQAHQDDLDQQGQYLKILQDAANSPAAQSWTPDQWGAYVNAVGGVGDVKSQKDAKKGGLGGIFQKLTGGPKGGSNLQEKLQQIFGGGTPMTQTSAPGQPAPDTAAPAAQSRYGSGPSPIAAVNGQVSPPFTNQVSGSPDVNAIQPTSPVPPMPESFVPRGTSVGGGPPIMQSTTASSGPPKLTMGGASPQWHDAGKVVDDDGNLIQTYVDLRTGKTMKVPLGGQDPIAVRIDQRAKVEAEKAKLIRKGDLDTVIEIGIKNGDYANYDAGLAVEGPKWNTFMHGKWNAPFEKEREARAAETDRAGRLRAREQEAVQKYNDYLLRANNNQQSQARLAFAQTQAQVKAIDEEINDLEDQYKSHKANRDRLYTNPPNPRLNPNDTPEAHDAQIDQYNHWMMETTEAVKAKRAAREALINSDPWMKTQDRTQPQPPVGKISGRRSGPPNQPPARKPAAPSGDAANPLGLRKPQ